MADDHDFIVKDSSIYKDISSSKLLLHRDATIKVGIVKEIKRVPQLNENRFVVEVWSNSQHIPVLCTYAVRFGGAYNFEEYNWRGFYAGQDVAGRGEYNARPGDTVIIAYLNGTSQEGVILGGLKHPSRVPEFDENSGIAYASEFNGIKQEISSDGEYKLTFRGIQTNISELDKAPDGSLVPAPKYDENIGTSYYKFDKTGSWTVSDNAKSDPQTIHIDKQNGKIVITSGKIILTMDKNSETTSLVTKELTIDAADKMDTTTKEWSTDASASAKIKSSKIAFGTDGIELLDQIVKALEGLGQVKAISPVGPCAPLMATGEWSEVSQVISKINSIKGSL